MRLRPSLERVRNLPPRSPSVVSTRWRRRCCGWVVSTLRTRPPRWKTTTCPTLTGCWTLSTAPSPSSQELFVTDSLQHFRLPDVGEGLTEADIVQWLVQPGDAVEVNQPIVEIETAKSLVELPSPYDGVVVELLFAEGDTVEVGTPIITIGPVGYEPTKDDAPAAGQESADEQDAPSDVLVGYGPKAGGAARRRRRVAPETPAPLAPGTPAPVSPAPAAPKPGAPAPAGAAPSGRPSLL